MSDNTRIPAGQKVLEGQNIHAGKKGIVVAAIAGSVVIVGLLVAVIVLLTIQRNASNALSEEIAREETKKRDVVVTPENIKEVVAALDESELNIPGTYEIKMNTTWHFTAGEATSSDAYVENVAGNTNDVYFDVIFEDIDEIIYESPVLPRGSHLSEITLKRSLDAGTYPAVLIYHLIDEEQNTISTVRVEIKMKVKK